jgi:hypothetical protein
MGAPLIIWVVFASFALPVFAARWRMHALDRPMKLVAAWYAVLVVESVAAIAWSHLVDRSNNLLLAQIFMPIEATLVLAALAEWQVHPIIRTTVRASIPLYWVAWAVALYLVEGAGNYSTVSGPLLGLLVLAAALCAFIARLQREDEALIHSVWGWVLPGLAMFFGINATATIVMAMAMVDRDYGLMGKAAVLRAWIYLFATLLITWGFLWPTRRESSGRSSSPPPSP